VGICCTEQHLMLTNTITPAICSFLLSNTRSRKDCHQKLRITTLNSEFRPINPDFRLVKPELREVPTARLRSAVPPRDRRMTRFPNDNSLERQTVENGKAEFPRDVSGHFVELCDACRRGDLEAVQTFVNLLVSMAHLLSRLVSNFGVDINRTDAFDASPLMLVCLF